jgi:hypothetical protein
MQWDDDDTRLQLSTYAFAHCGWAALRPSHSDFGQNWRHGTGEIPLLSLWLGTIEAQWFRLRPELEARDRGDYPTLTVVGYHWGPVILTSARIGGTGPGRLPYSHCGWAALRPSDSDFGQNWRHGIREIPLLLSNVLDADTTRPLINKASCTAEYIMEIKWSGTAGTRTQDQLILARTSPNHSTTDLHYLYVHGGSYS